jgi:tetratricopeptide (TPR) repeat protein
MSSSSAEAYNNLGAALEEEGKRDEALACYRRALELKPDYAEALKNIGNAFLEEGKLDEAISFLHRALTLNPNFARAHTGLGIVLREQGKMAEAHACFLRALELQPAFAWGHYNLGLLLLLLGRYEEGWREYERRLEVPNLAKAYPMPRWNGESAVGRTILLHGEQGFGDVIQFIRYAPLVKRRTGAGRVLMEAPPRLARLLQENTDWNAEIISGASSEHAAPVDCHASLLSLPLALGIFDPLPMTAPYLRADPALRREWRERLGVTSSRRVGLVWAGNPRHKLNRLRSMTAASLLPLIKTPGIEFYSLQMGDESGAGRQLAELGLVDLTGRIQDFADTAALVAELDLVISVDTAVAHLAGAMGRPVWTMLQFRGEWRWGLAGETTEWYPTMRLFRQPALGDWEAVVKRVAAELLGSRQKEFWTASGSDV